MGEGVVDGIKLDGHAPLSRPLAGVDAQLIPLERLHWRREPIDVRKDPQAGGETERQVRDRRGPTNKGHARRGEVLCWGMF
jgi:hypothetical protein